MQHAARVVADENVQLRALLAHHGVSDDEIERFLRGGTTIKDTHPGCQGESGAAPGQDARRVSRYPSPSPVRQPNDENLPPLSPAQSTSLPRLPLPESYLEIDVTKAAHLIPSLNGSCPVGMSSEANYIKADDEGTVQNYQSHSADACRTPKSTSNCRSIGDRPPSSMETLCDAAAIMIADLHGHRDRDIAYSALGCGGKKNCVVKNTELFDLLDGNPELVFRGG